ncbi:hypothetical protein C3941_13520 [Kaistia algarum]|uniref:aldose 1-epimerase n=1 Tax=Kaistia algarum TaxID=2083279 RepID=UPI000CE74241|nr:aldose 1-epimerase [Kaistia algarum]MCX5513765.1 aldose 1-epimerase [Kaistia algarum]PPE79367.1 hypothetical protein C3941_13520 [Kaistia algarum]
MADFEIANAALRLAVTTTGGSVWRFATSAGEPLFRAPPAGPDRAPLASGCFPLVPFGNRVRDNRFSFEGRDYAFEPNMDWDRHYLHGDGWTGEWEAAEVTPTSLALRYRHAGGGTPYRYEAEQLFSLDGSTLTTSLSITNRGPLALPFGLGWHPYFPLTPQTSLKASASHYWDEDESWLPTTRHPVGGAIDFSSPAPLPRRWVNTLFEGWNGEAEIIWPERGLALAIAADPVFSRYLVFVSDPAFDPGYDYDFFCFEPMSHSADAHHTDDGGLIRLEPGQSFSGTVRYSCSHHGAPTQQDPSR